MKSDFTNSKNLKFDLVKVESKKINLFLSGPWCHYGLFSEMN
jgi:hypothetical protein